MLPTVARFLKKVFRFQSRTVLVVLLFAQATCATEELVRQGDQAYFGLNQKQSYERAHSFYLEAADQGSVTAAHYLGFMYSQGLGVEKNKTQAVSWFKRAALDGHAASQYSLGQIAENGVGSKPDFTKAHRWYKKAADQGYALAQRQLSLLYARGKGVQPNYAWATYYAAKAAQQGDAIASKILEEVVPRLPSFTTQAEYTSLYSMPSETAKQVAQVFELSQVYQLDQIRGDWVTVYSPETRVVAYLNVNDLIPTAATAAGR